MNAKRLIGHRVERRMKEMGYESDEALAHDANVTVKTIWRLRNGHSYPREATARAVATALNLPLSELRPPQSPDEDPELREQLAEVLSRLQRIELAVGAQAPDPDLEAEELEAGEEAQHWFRHHHPRRDPSGLDADHDGIACESNPCPCNHHKPPGFKAQPTSHHRTVRLAISPAHFIDSTGGQTHFLAVAPPGWHFKRPHDTCTASGVDWDGIHQEAYLRHFHLRRADFGFKAEEVWNDLTVRCTRLSHVKVKTIRRRHSVLREWPVRGVDTSSRRARGDCFTRPDRSALLVGCSGQGSAVAKYRFRLPDGAYSIRRSATGGEVCCGAGVIQRDWAHDGRTFTYTVKVTGFRTYEIQQVEIEFVVKVWHRIHRRTTIYAPGAGYRK